MFVLFPGSFVSWLSMWEIWSHYVETDGENYTLHSLSPSKSFKHFCFDIPHTVRACLSFISPFFLAFFLSLFQLFFLNTRCIFSPTWNKHSRLAFHSLFFFSSFFALSLSSWLRFSARYQINTETKPPCKASIPLLHHHPPLHHHLAKSECRPLDPLNRKSSNTEEKSLSLQLWTSDFGRHLFPLWNFIKYCWRGFEGSLRGDTGDSLSSIKCQPGTR